MEKMGDAQHLQESNDSAKTLKWRFIFYLIICLCRFLLETKYNLRESDINRNLIFLCTWHINWVVYDFIQVFILK